MVAQAKGFLKQIHVIGPPPKNMLGRNFAKLKAPPTESGGLIGLARLCSIEAPGTNRAPTLSHSHKCCSCHMRVFVRASTCIACRLAAQVCLDVPPDGRMTLPDSDILSASIRCEMVWNKYKCQQVSFFAHHVCATCNNGKGLPE